MKNFITGNKANAATLAGQKGLKHFQGILNEDRISGNGVNKKGSLRLSRRGDGALVLGIKARLPPARAECNGKAYVRLYSKPSPSESIVRANLKLFVERVFDLVVENCTKGLINPKASFSKNLLSDVEGMCMDFDGIGSSGFVSKSGEPLKRNRAFAYAIRQFFKDERFAMSVCLDAIRFYQGKLENGK
ncbi:MAG: hypothetical protein WC506_04335 [Candidatus Micrarchaeia archaeon]